MCHLAPMQLAVYAARDSQHPWQLAMCHAMLMQIGNERLTSEGLEKINTASKVIVLAYLRPCLMAIFVQSAFLQEITRRNRATNFHNGNV